MSLKSLYTSIWPNFILIGLDLEFKRNNQKCNSYYEAMSGDVTDFEICGFHENKKSRYPENETFVLQIEQTICYTSRTTLWQKIVL